MYKLTIYIYSNHVPFDEVKSLMSLKVWANLGLSKKNSKSSYVGLFLENHTKSNFSIRIPLYANLGFHKKMSFLQICSNGHMRAKRAPRASERASRASEPSFVSESGAVFANQANQANQPWSLRAKRFSRVSEPSAVYFLKFALMGTFEQSALRERQTKQNKPANKQVKQIKLAKLKPYQGK